MEIQVNIKDKVLKPIEEVFENIINPEKLSGFFCSSSSGPLEQGKRTTWRFDDFNMEVTVHVFTVKKNELITFEWPASGINTRVSIFLERIDDKTTQIKINEDGWPMDKDGVRRALGQNHGWTDFICSLKAYMYSGIRLRAGKTVELYQKEII